MCVLLTWMHVNQVMKLFSNMTPQGWLIILFSFAGSLAANFIFNPLMWVVAGCYIYQARKAGRSSRWQFYPGLIGILLVASLLTSVFSSVKIPSQLLSFEVHQEKNGPAADHPAYRIPELSGIMFSQSDPKALINGSVVHQGDEIGGFVIDEIKENSVTFEAPDGSQIVRQVK